jgi:hypothetical protein
MGLRSFAQFGCGQRGFDHLRVGAAAANVSADRLSYVLGTGVRIALEQRDTTHNHSGGTVSALHSIVLDQRRLHGMKPMGVAQPFDRRDLPIADIHREGHARVYRHAIEPYRASRTRTTVADNLGASHPQLIPENIGQGGARFDWNSLSCTVNVENDQSGFGADRVRSTSVDAMQ